MNGAWNIYCDESGHLDHVKGDVMVLGCVWCPSDKAQEVNHRLRQIIKEHGLPAAFEFKWTKVSPGGGSLYLNLLDYFFSENDLHFRAVVIPDKSKIDHLAHGQTNEDWYYKMYFVLLSAILDPQATSRIFLDYKDTRGGRKVEKLHEVLCNNLYDFSRTVVQRMQIVHSREVPLVQLADLLIGAVSYANRNLSANRAKHELVEVMQKRSGYRLTRTTLLRESKVNILRWKASESVI